MRRAAAVVLLLLAVPAAAEAPPSPATPQTTSAAADAVNWADCLACHDDPLQTLPALLELRPAMPGGATATDCAACHSAAELLELATSADWTHPVRPVGSHIGCEQCHPVVPHSAADPPPMPVGDYRAEGCYECHRNVDAERRMLHAHAVVPALQCRDCHPAHQPLRAALPLELQPSALRRRNYDPYTSNAACFACHSSAELLLSSGGGFIAAGAGTGATGPGTNLHELHVVSGRNLCTECHEPHGALGRGMLRDELLSGGALLHRADNAGGTCTTLCHGVEHFSTPYQR